MKNAKITLMLLVANLAITYNAKKHTENWFLDGFQKSLRSCAMDESSLSIGRFFNAETTFIQRGGRNLNHLNPVMLVFIGKLLLCTLR